MLLSPGRGGWLDAAARVALKGGRVELAPNAASSQIAAFAQAVLSAAAVVDAVTEARWGDSATAVLYQGLTPAC